jgi:hypothetical protein
MLWHGLVGDPLQDHRQGFAAARLLTSSGFFQSFGFGHTVSSTEGRMVARGAFLILGLLVAGVCLLFRLNDRFL